MAAGALAGFLKGAGVSDIGFVRASSPDCDFAQLGAREHATIYGDLVTNGMIWAERALGGDLGADSDCTLAALRDAGRGADWQWRVKRRASQQQRTFGDQDPLFR